MEKKTTSMSDFQIQGKLGEGAFGQVFKVRRKADGQIYALKKVKIASMKEKDRQNALNEIRILASYEGQHIIGYKDSFFEESTSTLCVVMEFAGGGDILRANQTHTRKKTHYQQSQIWRALVDITKGVKSLHDRKVLHRDIKAANIFKTTEGVYKLGDLNVSKVLKNTLAKTQTGTPYYVSPQIWKDKPYGVKSDIWSLGCVVYEMASLRPPFLGNDLQSLYRNVCKGIYPRIPLQYSEQLAVIINSMLKQDPSARPTTQEVLSNSIVHKNYPGNIDFKSKDNSQNNPLLKTLKLNHKNLRALKNILPKSKYDLDRSEQKQRDISRQKSKESRDGDGSNSNRSHRKSVKEIMNDKKINNFLEVQQKKQEENRKKFLEAIQKREKQQLQSPTNPQNRMRQRVLSACGIRRPQCMTPEPKRKQSNVKLPPSTKNQRKESQNYPPIKLPPKPQAQNPNIPQQGIIAPRQPKIQRQSSNYKQNRSIDGSRQKSRQNFKNIGQRIISGNSNNVNENFERQKVRCSSAKRIVYPSWWMD